MGGKLDFSGMYLVLGNVPPGTALVEGGQVAPEFQLVNETTVGGYLNFMQDAVNSGVGENREVKPDYTRELALASDAGALLDRIDLLLMHGSMPTRLRGQILTAINGVSIPTATASKNKASD